MSTTNWHKKFKEFLDTEGLTTHAAAEKSGIPYSTLCAYLNGTRRPSDTNKKVISSKLNFNVYVAMYGDLHGTN